MLLAGQSLPARIVALKRFCLFRRRANRSLRWKRPTNRTWIRKIVQARAHRLHNRRRHLHLDPWRIQTSADARIVAKRSAFTPSLVRIAVRHSSERKETGSSSMCSGVSSLIATGLILTVGWSIVSNFVGGMFQAVEELNRANNLPPVSLAPKPIPLTCRQDAWPRPGRPTAGPTFVPSE